MRFIVVLIVILFSQNIFASPVENPIISREVLFGNPEKANMQLSQDGKYISWLAPQDGVLNIWIAPIDDLSHPKPLRHKNKRAIHGYGWTCDGKHILYTQDNEGDENHNLYAYNLETKKTTALTSKRGARVGWWWISESKPNEVIMLYNARDERYGDLYRISLTDYKKEMIFENHKFAGFTLDNDLVPRFGESFDEETGASEYYKLDSPKQELFIKYAPQDSENSYIFGFDKTNTIVYILDSCSSDTLTLKSFDLNTGKTKTLYNDKRVDVFPVASHLETWKSVQIIGAEYDKVTYKVLDKSVAKDVKYLKSISSGHFGINSRTTDDKLWLVYYYSDTKPAQYYLYDRDKEEAKFLFSSLPELEQYKLVPMESVVIKARDGLNMMSYLTLPPNKEANKPVPMVLMVHGGPVYRDGWGLNEEHQWLANRGYAVLSVNYRGSSGFGKKFVNAGARQWGLKMQDDLVDAVNWAIDKKIADPQKICIMGGSYGGYAVLAGLTFTPNLFACGVDIVGISDITTFLQTMPTYWKGIYGLMKRRVGDWETDEGKADMMKRSPINFAERIKKPLLIAHGANDPRVKQAESERIVAKMRKNNIPITYLLYEDEGHGFARPESSMSFYAMTEEFLANVLGGRVEPISDKDFKGAHFLLNGKKNVKAKEAKGVIDNSHAPNVILN